MIYKRSFLRRWSLTLAGSRNWRIRWTSQRTWMPNSWGLIPTRLLRSPGPALPKRNSNKINQGKLYLPLIITALHNVIPWLTAFLLTVVFSCLISKKKLNNKLNVGQCIAVLPQMSPVFQNLPNLPAWMHPVFQRFLCLCISFSGHSHAFLRMWSSTPPASKNSKNNNFQ